MTLDPRLKTIAALVRGGKGLIDVGTDHAKLPLYLVMHGYDGKLYASDINSGPLLNARKNAAKAGLNDRIGFLLCDGLDDCPRDEIDTIVIAGMGGEQICGILDRAEWCWDSRYRLILQPMTKQEVLRYWLVNNGYDLDEEHIVPDKNAFYQIISARFNMNSRISDAELFTGRREHLLSEQAAGPFLDRLILRFETRLNGLTETERPFLDAETVILQNILYELKDMRCAVR